MLLLLLLLPLGATLLPLGVEPPLSLTARLPASTATPRLGLLMILLLTTETPSCVLLIVRGRSSCARGPELQLLRGSNQVTESVAHGRGDRRAFLRHSQYASRMDRVGSEK